MTVSTEAYRDLAQACQKRAEERDNYYSALLLEQVDDHERRCEVAKMLGITGDCGIPPKWPILLTRLNECLTTYRGRRGS